jgi:hypothetical protein
MQQDLRKTRFVRLVLTEEQRDEVQRQTGQVTEAIELTPEELEERAVPKLAANHNETLVAEPLEDRVVPKIAYNHNETMLDGD